jgi:hypothetical protein
VLKTTNLSWSYASAPGGNVTEAALQLFGTGLASQYAFDTIRFRHKRKTNAFDTKHFRHKRKTNAFDTSNTPVIEAPVKVQTPELTLRRSAQDLPLYGLTPRETSRPRRSSVGRI